MELKIIDELIGGMPSWTEEANCKGSEKFGIWGGLSERERRRIKRQRAAEFDVRDVG